MCKINKLLGSVVIIFTFIFSGSVMACGPSDSTMSDSEMIKTSDTTRCGPNDSSDSDSK